MSFRSRHEHDGIGRQCAHCGYPIPRGPHQSQEAAATLCCSPCLEAPSARALLEAARGAGRVSRPGWNDERSH